MIGTAGLAAGRASARPRLRHALVALGCGLLTVGALPPLHLLPGLLGLAGLAALLWRSSGPGEAALFGFCFGLGWFGAGLYWVGIAFYADAERFGALAVPGVMALTAICAAFTASAAGLMRAWRWRSPWAWALAFAAIWTLFELLRGWLVQFPWNPVGLAWVAIPPMLQLVAWLGSPGLSFLTALAAGLLGAAIVTGGARRRATSLTAAALLLVMALAGAARLWLVPVPAPTDTRLRLVQANVPQENKWDPELRARWFERHLTMSTSDWVEPPAATIWPESAVPYQIGREPIVRELLGRVVPPDGYLIAGGDHIDFVEDPPVAHNSLWAVDGRGEVATRYDKVDLVPFGEFLPFRAILETIGLEKLTAGSFDFGSGPGRVTVALPGLPAFSPLICYEAIYPGRTIAAAGPRPAFLLNITNDAWFGTSSGPYQHLGMARMRAVETGLPLVRAANTGISVVTDARGRIEALLPLNEQGVLDAVLPGRLPERPLFDRLGWRLLVPLLLGALLVAVLVELAGRRRRAG